MSRRVTFARPAAERHLRSLARELGACESGSSVRAWVTPRGRIYVMPSNLHQPGDFGGVPATGGRDHDVDELWDLLGALWAHGAEGTTE